MRYLLLALLFCSDFSRAGELNIQSGRPDKSIAVTCYSGLRELKTTAILTDDRGFARYTGDYSGFLLLEIESTGIFPVILGKEPVTFTIDDKGFPHFSDSQNTWFYDALNRKKRSDGQLQILHDDLSFFLPNDPFHAILIKKEEEIDSDARKFDKEISENTGRLAAILLQGQMIIEHTYGIKTKEELNDRKKEMFVFLSLNYPVLYHSDMFRQMAFQYAMMNEYVAQSREEQFALVLADIGDWISMFRNRFTPEEITGFFLEMAAGRRMISLAVEIQGKFGVYTGCPVDLPPGPRNTALPDLLIHVWKSDNPAIPLSRTSKGKKLLIFYDEDCVFSLPGHVRMMGLLEKNGLTLPVITVFAGKNSPPELEDLVLPRKVSYWYRDDPVAGIRLTSLLGLEKYPAFVILDPEPAGIKVFYTGDEAIQTFIHSGK